MGKIIRRVIAILLCATAVMLAVIPAETAEATSTHGDYEYDGATVAKYIGSDSEVTLPAWVNRVGKEAFEGYDKMTKLVIPDAVTTVDFGAFSNCSNLQTVRMSESVRTLGSSAFSGCTSLYSVSIPRKVSSIGSGTFAGCTSLSNIPVAEANPDFLCHDGVLYSGDGKEVVQYLAGRPSTVYVMPASVEKINEYAFWGAPNLTGVAISGQVKEIPEYAFSNCPGLSTIVIPASVSKIQAYAFSDCINLRSAVIPTSVGYISDLAFYMSNGVQVQFVEPSDPMVTGQVAAVSGTGLSGSTDAYNDAGGNVNAEGTEDADETAGATDADGFPISPTPVVSIDYEENILPGEMGSTKVVGSQAVLLMSPSMTVKGSYNLNKAELEDGIANSNLKNTSKEDAFSVIRGVLDRYNGTDENVSVPSDITVLGNRSFYKNDKIRNVSLSSGVAEIGDFAIARSTVESVNIPDSTEKIGYAAFYHCSDLADVSIPDSVESIELGAFLGTPWLYNWQTTEDNDNYLIVGDHILLSYKGEGGNVTIPEGVKKIAPGCFLGNTSITGVSIPGSVTTIGEDAFNGCTSLNTVSLSSGLEKIEDRAFRNTNLSTLSIPPSVKSIGLGAFDLLDTAKVETVLFTGTSLPDVESKPTASRLSARDLRVLAFDGIDNAIIRDTADPDSGTIFDPKHLGFRGAVYSLSSDVADGQNTLHMIRATKLPDEDGIVDIDAHVSIGSTEYLMSGIRENALDPYADYASWSDLPLKDIRINGNTSNEVEALLDSVADHSGRFYTPENAIRVQDVRSSAIQSGVPATAVIPGNTDPFKLTISDDSTSQDVFRAAFLNALGQAPSSSMQMFDISMTDGSGTIPIKKLNTDKMEITLPVPANLAGSQDLQVLTINDNGALENVAAESVDVNGTQSLKFVAGHFSPYAICHASDLYAYHEEVLVETQDENAEEELMDVAQDLFSIRVSSGSLTKEPTSGIPLVRIIAIILLAGGIFLLLWNLTALKKKRA